MMISVLVGVTRTSTPEYPSSASSLVRNSFSSALKTPSATNFHTRVSILSQFSCQELVQFSLENTVGDELPFFGDLCRHFALSCRSESSNIKVHLQC